jgi:hypothetical protein
MTEMKNLLEQMGHHEAKHTPQEKEVVQELSESFERSALSLAQRLQNFPRHVRRQDISRFLAKYELFRQALPVNGSIVECGVFAGGGLAGRLHFSSILESYNPTRRIIGFDTSTGFPSVDDKDRKEGTSDHLHAGAFQISSGMRDEIASITAIHDRNRPLGHIPKVELLAGDATQSIPRYVAEHPHLLISLIYLDFDLYSPTKVALEHLFPRVVKGGIVVFDELNCAEFPGETTALLEALDLSRVELRRTPLDPHISYFIK